MSRSEGRFGIRDVTHDYSGVVVLRRVDFELTAGRIHALVGENGSGKSTLTRLLTAALRAPRGSLYLDGEELELKSPADAQTRGVAVVHQDYHLFGDLTVAENVLGINENPPRRGWSRRLDKAELRRRVVEMFSNLEISIPLDLLARELGPAERKFVEIARAMFLEPRFLIFDEPTASLEPSGSASVLSLLERLRADGLGLCFVSHRLDEVLRIADEVTVLRDGVRIAHLQRDEVTEPKLARLITGSDQPAATPAARRAPAGRPKTVLRVSDLTVVPGSDPIHFEVAQGEIFGLTGLLGSGAAEIVRMLGGAQPLMGELEMHGNPASIQTPRDASRLGIGFIPEDRKGAGLIPDQSVAINISLSSLSSVAVAGWLRFRQLTARALHYRTELDIKVRSVRASTRTLSGGNQQKVMLAKWLASGAKLLAIEEPTHGVDIGAKRQVHDLLRGFTADGGTIVLASTDVREVLELCDRIAIMRHGAMTEVLSSSELTRAEVTLRGAGDPEALLESLVESGHAGADA
jgi:ABC-type sugar transport system ATPase subunit